MANIILWIFSFVVLVLIVIILCMSNDKPVKVSKLETHVINERGEFKIIGRW